MFFNICYYLFATSTFCCTAFGFYYFYDKRNAQILLYSMSWKSLETYTKCKLYIKNNIYPYFQEEEEEEEELQVTKEEEKVMEKYYS